MHKMYLNALYRKNNFGQPCIWHCEAIDDNTIQVSHGIVGKTITKEKFKTHRKVADEITSRINAKRKTGYKLLQELKDNVELPVEGELMAYLLAYLPDYRTTKDGTMLPMLAKAYDNTNNKLFKKTSSYYAQWKINGLRCFISAERNNDNMFMPIRLIFQSREGIYWHTLANLEDYLLSVIPTNFLNKMVEEHYILDGEIYLPGASVNEINHYVKNMLCNENKLLQYWCYDIAIEDMGQAARLDILYDNIGNFSKAFSTKDEHLNNDRQLIVLPYINCYSDGEAISLRDSFILKGFEGLILRNPDAEYQYGKRNSSMIKYKRTTDGKFVIVDIYPEGLKRQNIPLILCKNDINNETFEVHINGSFEYQENILKNKDKYIGKTLFISYGERSGIAQVPFHVKEVKLFE